LRLKNKRLLIVCHDAGGAEIISSWVKKHFSPQYQFFLRGPAVTIFQRKVAHLHLAAGDDLSAAIAEAEMVLTGSGWQTDWEKKAIAISRELGIPVATFLDHWVGYKERFMLNGTLVLPDEIWVGDVHAQSLAKSTFPRIPIRLEPNPYLLEIVEAIKELSQKDAAPGDELRILYLCEPTSKGAQTLGLGYTEFEALEGYLRYLKEQQIKSGRIRVRPHPSEPAGKYRKIIEKYRGDFELEQRETTLVEDCSWADWVVGCNSMAMAIAVMAGKQVFSCIPKGGSPITLPFPEVIRLFNP
jgi:hypothetical protein